MSLGLYFVLVLSSIWTAKARSWSNQILELLIQPTTHSVLGVFLLDLFFPLVSKAK